MKASGVAPTCTPVAYSRITSRTGVVTTGFCAAMYSSVLVGLMKAVEAFIANGSRQTSQPATRAGSSA
ncbi:hypothetical protein D9M71_765810 [compost metagenome]